MEKTLQKNSDGQKPHVVLEKYIWDDDPSDKDANFKLDDFCFQVWLFWNGVFLWLHGHNPLTVRT